MSKILPHRAIDADPDLNCVKFPCSVQPKLDGVRGINLTGEMTGRTLKPFKNRYTTAFYSHPVLRGLDGEMVAGTEDKAPDLCRRTTSALNTISGSPQTTWYLFDYVVPETIWLPYQDRREELITRVESIKDISPEFSGKLCIVPHIIATSKEEIKEAFQLFLNQKYEGAIIRWLKAPHKNGYCTEREAYYLRIKDFGQEEAVVVGMTEAEANLNEAKTNLLGKTERSSHKENKFGKGMLGALVCENTRWGRFLVGPGTLTHLQRTYYWNNPSEIVGKVITYKYLKVGCKDAPRMATYQHIRMTEDL